MIDRRQFCKNALLFAGGLALPLGALELFDPQRLEAERAGKDKIRWVFLVDIRKCVGCGFCVKACKIENDVPYDAKVSRTWVERYVITSNSETPVHAPDSTKNLDDRVLIDSPNAARDGFTTSRIDLNLHGMKEVNEAEITKAFFVPKLCNQCDNPPCVQVCPVGATYQTADGVVLVDRKWCIGCGYCIMGCPYGVRFFHPVYHVAEKCNFCYHRLARGMKTACVDACPFGARRIGNLRDPDDPVAKIIATEPVAVLKEEYGTKPQLFYLGMSMEVK